MSIKFLHFKSNSIDKSIIWAVNTKLGPEELISLKDLTNIILVDIRNTSKIIHRLISSKNTPWIYFAALSFSKQLQFIIFKMVLGQMASEIDSELTQGERDIVFHLKIL
mgnify:CR=1 FL=1